MKDFTNTEGGEKAMKLALEKLGYRNVYNMSTFISHTEDFEKWKRVIDNSNNNDNNVDAKTEWGLRGDGDVWDDLLGDYQATVSSPTCYFAPTLIPLYPRAKIIILTRDRQQWYASFSKTVQLMIAKRQRLHLFQSCLPRRASAIVTLGNLLSKSGIGLGTGTEEECLEFFDRYYYTCRKAVEIEGRRREVLEFDVGQGWGPLCGFLGRDVPGGGEGFPMVNDAEAFGVWVGTVQRDLWWELGGYVLFYTGVVVVLVVLVMVGWKRGVGIL
ncbi:hypothetical protein GGS20DRAFT_122094 [Poronia punctata]|nr:hypothetical protein GGS20DRAFT_122094 [Poronia punctata]